MTICLPQGGDHTSSIILIGSCGFEGFGVQRLCTPGTSRFLCWAMSTSSWLKRTTLRRYILFLSLSTKTEENLSALLAEQLNFSSLVPLGVTLVGLSILGKF